MNKLVPFSKFTGSIKGQHFLSKTFVVVDENNIPLGFVFGRDSFISFCTTLDNDFEKKVKDLKKAYDNPAGKLIDLIEERLPINPAFTKKLKSSISQAKKSGWIPLETITHSLDA